MGELFRPCPFCGSRAVVYECFGRLAADCRDERCRIKPSTWLTGRDIYDVRKLAKFWNQRPKNSAAEDRWEANETPATTAGTAS